MGERVVEVLEGVDWYDHPKWYDVLHWPGTIEEARGMIAVGRRFVGLDDDETARFFEPACGTARHLRVLGGLGHACIGLDMSAAMLGYGRERLAAREIGGVDLVKGDMTRFGIGDVGGKPFDVAFCLANSIRHLASDDAMVDHLRCVRAALAPGGVYAVGIGLTAYGVEPVSEDVWTGSRGPLRVTQAVQYEPATASGRSERVVSQLCVVGPEKETHVSHSYGLRSYDAREWSGLVEAAGYTVEGVVDETGESVDWWDWRAGGHGYGVFVLRPA